MGELTVGKVFSSLLMALAMQWAYVPRSIGLLLVCMAGDLVLGFALSVQRDEPHKLHKLGVKILLKMSAFVILGLTLPTQEAMRLQWDAFTYFANALTAFEFMSAADSHIKLGGPGAAGLAKVVAAIKSVLASRDPLASPQEAQDAAAVVLERQARAGEDSRL